MNGTIVMKGSDVGSIKTSLAVSVQQMCSGDYLGCWLYIDGWGTAGHPPFFYLPWLPNPTNFQTKGVCPLSDRDYRITVRLDSVEAQRLQRLTRETSTTPVEVIRVLIRNTEPAYLEQLYRLEQP